MHIPWRWAIHISAATSLLLSFLVALVILHGNHVSQVFPFCSRQLRCEPDGTACVEVSWFDYHNRVLTNQNVTTIRVNLFELLGGFSVAPIAWLIMRYHSRHRRPANSCKACGYDLTGNVNGICSECGTQAGLRWRIIAQFHVERMKGTTTRRLDD